MIQTIHRKLHLELILAKYEITELKSKRNRILEEFEDVLYDLERKKEQNILLKIENKKLINMLNEIEEFIDKIKQENEEKLINEVIDKESMK